MIIKHKKLFQIENENIMLDLGKGNSSFCCMSSQENYFGLLGWQNNNNPKIQSQQI